MTGDHATDRPRLTWRGRVLAWMAGLLITSTLLTVLVARPLLVADVDDTIAAQLAQEAVEFSQTADENDPRTGQPIGDDTRRLLELHLQRNVPAANEVFVGLLEGRPVVTSASDVPVSLEQDADLVARWGALSDPGSGTAETAAGTVRWLAVPVDGSPRGTMAFAWFVDLERAGDERVVWQLTIAQVVIGLGLLLALGRLLTRQLSRPLAALTSTTRSIQASDLTRRVPVHGDDELGELADTINDLLGRLDGALASQRRFLAEASHELRTPITIVQGHLDTLEDDADARAATLDLVHDELDRMAGLVGDLLLLTSAQQIDFVRRELVDLVAFADTIEQTLRPLATHEIVATSSPGRASLDPHRIRQAVTALVDNAVTHAPQGTVVAVRISRQAPDTTTIVVTDRGPGIPPALRERVFERFQRGGTRAEGAGLGLPIVRAIARAHGGEAWIESTGSAGTSVALRVPDVAPPQHGAGDDGPPPDRTAPT